MIVALGEPFPEPTLPGWGDLPTDLIQAMEEAHGNAAYAYGDEGNGYNPHLMLAYLLQSDAFKAAFIPTPTHSRDVWGVQVGTWPPEQYQSEEIARWYAEQPAYQGRAYPVHVVKGTEYSVDWQIVDTVQAGE